MTSFQKVLPQVYKDKAISTFWSMCLQVLLTCSESLTLPSLGLFFSFLFLGKANKQNTRVKWNRTTNDPLPRKQTNQKPKKTYYPNKPTILAWTYQYRGGIQVLLKGSFVHYCLRSAELHCPFLWTVSVSAVSLSSSASSSLEVKAVMAWKPLQYCL